MITLKFYLPICFLVAFILLNFSIICSSLDEHAVGLTAAEVRDQLMEGEPRIAATLAKPQGIRFTVFMNESGEEKLAAKRMREILGGVGG